LTRKLDLLRQQFEGSPVEMIKPALKRVWEADGRAISDPELTEYAEAICNGTRIEVVFDGI
jgi:hypothetical protein